MLYFNDKCEDNFYANKLVDAEEVCLKTRTFQRILLRGVVNERVYIVKNNRTAVYFIIVAKDEIYKEDIIERWEEYVNRTLIKMSEDKLRPKVYDIMKDIFLPSVADYVTTEWYLEPLMNKEIITEMKQNEIVLRFP